MFELGREFMRLFAGERMRPFSDGLTGGDATLLELLDLNLLNQEAKIDQSARQKIESQRRTILEGSQEWDILYRKYYNEEVKKLGV